MPTFDAEDRADTFVPHSLPEQVVDLGEIRMNYATVGSSDRPALLLVPAQTESWWGYEDALSLFGEHFQAFAVDLRGQGRSTWTPGRYTLDIMGNDLVRFIDAVIGRPTVVSGNSSGGVLAAWLAAYARPGQVRGAVLEDPPLFASEVDPACGHSIRQAIGPLFAHFNKWLGDQWTIGDWQGMQAAAPDELPPEIVVALAAMAPPSDAADGLAATGTEPPQNMREYDPEWARSFVTGRVAASCDHARMLASARAPMLLTHHFRTVDETTGRLLGAISDEQVRRARELVTSAGQRFEVESLPDMAHAMHRHDPDQFVRIVSDWASRLPSRVAG
jgi:pimeloyl-ACP methyl ester carboxylesterase